MTLFIAYMLMNYVGGFDGWTYFWVGLLWFAHCSFHATKGE